MPIWKLHVPVRLRRFFEVGIGSFFYHYSMDFEADVHKPPYFFLNLGCRCPTFRSKGWSAYLLEKASAYPLPGSAISRGFIAFFGGGIGLEVPRLVSTEWWPDG